jgi:hypothetical protein
VWGGGGGSGQGRMGDGGRKMRGGGRRCRSDTRKMTVGGGCTVPLVCVGSSNRVRNTQTLQTGYNTQSKKRCDRFSPMVMDMLF